MMMRMMMMMIIIIIIIIIIINKYKLTELSPTTNQTLYSVIMKREHVC